MCVRGYTNGSFCLRAYTIEKILEKLLCIDRIQDTGKGEFSANCFKHTVLFLFLDTNDAANFIIHAEATSKTSSKIFTSV